ncbi:hypothetical protein TNCV_4257071 [Trichonephila clavipes]|nr:hypothetical protein TNCV_4257071 [Trichonephila clavipes]
MFPLRADGLPARSGDTRLPPLILCAAQSRQRYPCCTTNVVNADVRYYDQKLSDTPDSGDAWSSLILEKIPGMSHILQAAADIRTMRTSTKGTAISYTKLFCDLRHDRSDDLAGR